MSFVLKSAPMTKGPFLQGHGSRKTRYTELHERGESLLRRVRAHDSYVIPAHYSVSLREAALAPLTGTGIAAALRASQKPF